MCDDLLVKTNLGGAFPMSLMRVHAQDHTMKRVAFRKGDWKEQENETMLSRTSCYTIIIIIIIFFKGWYNILAKIKLKIWHEIKGFLWNKILKVTFISLFSLVQLIKLHFCIQEFHGKMATLNWLSFWFLELFSSPQSITHASLFAHMDFSRLMAISTRALRLYSCSVCWKGCC
jgi:hypothetical protein